jgi:hypothetical protein
VPLITPPAVVVGLAHNGAAMRAATLVVLLLLSHTGAVAAQTPAPSAGDLVGGPYAVGFRILTVSDPSRPTGPRVGPTDRTPTRARELRLHVWYPATPGAGAAMTIGDYLAQGSRPGVSGAAIASSHRQDVSRLVAVTMTDADWARYTGAPAEAVLDAPPAAGRFPLLTGMLRPISSVMSAEYLASHGYVVGLVERQARESFVAEGLTLEGLVINEHQRDVQMAIARLRTEPNVDAARLGLLGYAADGLASLPLAMRHPDVDAVALMETNWLQPSGVSTYQQVAAFDPTALRAPLFFAYSEILGRNALEQVANIESMRYAPRHLLYFGEPRMTPLDFFTEGALTSQVLDLRREARAGTGRVMLATLRYLVIFFDTYVRSDGTARTQLDEVPVPRVGGSMIELRSLPAVAPALTRTEFRLALDANPSTAVVRARVDLQRDPSAPVFDEAWLSAQGYDAAIRGLSDRAIAIYTLMTEAAPRSANAFDTLSDMLERAGRKAEALAAAEKGLALLPADRTVAAPDRATLEAGLRARIARLK